MARQKKSQEQKNIEKEIEIVLKKKDRLVAERLRMEIRNRIIERQMNTLSAELQTLINRLVEAPPALTMEEISAAQNNRGSAIMMLRKRLPNLPIDACREMIDDCLRSSNHEPEEMSS
jgi:hypothetical protein